MAQEYKVSKAFQGTEQDTKQPTVIPTKAGNCHKYLVQVVGQPVPGWMQILRKIGPDGNSMPIKEGDSLYGSISENNWGKPEFKREQRPEGQAAPVMGPAPTNVPSFSQQPATSELEAKVDYIISLLENFLDARNGVQPDQPAGPAESPTNNDGDEAPVNLDNLDY